MNNPITLITGTVAGLHFCCADSYMMERVVVRQFIYPALLRPPISLTFGDQYAFRPTGSTTSAIIDFLHTVTHLLDNPYVCVIALDFSKAEVQSSPLYTS